MEQTTKLIDDTESDFDFHLVELEPDFPTEDVVIEATKSKDLEPKEISNKDNDINMVTDYFNSNSRLETENAVNTEDAEDGEEATENMYSPNTQKLMKDVESVLSFSKEVHEQLNRI